MDVSAQSDGLVPRRLCLHKQHASKGCFERGSSKCIVDVVFSTLHGIHWHSFVSCLVVLCFLMGITQYHKKYVEPRAAWLDHAWFTQLSPLHFHQAPKVSFARDATSMCLKLKAAASLVLPAQSDSSKLQHCPVQIQSNITMIFHYSSQVSSLAVPHSHSPSCQHSAGPSR